MTLLIIIGILAGMILLAVFIMKHSTSNQTPPFDSYLAVAKAMSALTGINARRVFRHIEDLKIHPEGIATQEAVACCITAILAVSAAKMVRKTDYSNNIETAKEIEKAVTQHAAEAEAYAGNNKDEVLRIVCNLPVDGAESDYFKRHPEGHPALKGLENVYLEIMEGYVNPDNKNSLVKSSSSALIILISLLAYEASENKNDAEYFIAQALGSISESAANKAKSSFQKHTLGAIASAACVIFPEKKTEELQDAFAKTMVEAFRKKQ
ncbi:MAG: hypothetical protein LBM04_00730 [Opitutaceae bacterium]|jgi:hypothetical protein|nr:hypothetical protein [Opitutaceae bacterium]